MNNLYLFFIASLLLNLTPGNDMLYVMSRSLSQGVKGGIYSAIGVFLGCLVHIAAAVFGLSIIIAKSAFLFELIKLAGAGYLIYLGTKALLSKQEQQIKLSNIPEVSYNKLIKEGMITNALNPKVAIFFLSFLPQFIDTTGDARLQLFLFGIWFAVQGTLILIIVAFITGRAAGFINRNPLFFKIQEKVTGLILVALGIKVALTARK